MQDRAVELAKLFDNQEVITVLTSDQMDPKDLARLEYLASLRQKNKKCKKDESQITTQNVFSASSETSEIAFLPDNPIRTASTKAPDETKKTNHDPNAVKEDITNDQASIETEKDKDVAPEDHKTLCWSCHAPSSTVRLLRCRGCRRARYCDAQCHAADWERHQGYCVDKQQKRENKEKEKNTA